MVLSAAIILAAGEGSRMRTHTPKALHTLAGKTFLQRVISSVKALTPQQLAVVVRYEAERLAQAAQQYDPDVVIVNQDELPGTGRALQCAMSDLQERGVTQGTVMVVACDMPLLSVDTLQKFCATHEQHGNDATILTTVLTDPRGYGRIIRDEQSNFVRIVEQRDANAAELAINEVNTSVYLFDVAMLQQALPGLQAQNAQGEFYLTDALEVAAKHGKVGAYEASDPLSVQGVNDRVQLANLARQYNQRICEHWMREGVTILDPNSTWIEDDVTLDIDVTILPGSYIQGHTTIASGAVIGPDTTLINAQIDHDAVVERSRVENCMIGQRATIGPWTYLRPGNTLDSDTKAGAFVEMKKSHIRQGSKVPHLSYIGDAEVGEHTNVGGGTITANYDGVHKHQTHIGDDVHVGAGNLLVAPVSVGNGVTTGAGTVIRHDVPPEALVYSENTEHVIEGWQPKSLDGLSS